jgi:hypothetical protein
MLSAGSLSVLGETNDSPFREGIATTPSRLAELRLRSRIKLGRKKFQIPLESY